MQRIVLFSILAYVHVYVVRSNTLCIPSGVCTYLCILVVNVDGLLTFFVASEWNKKSNNNMRYVKNSRKKKRWRSAGINFIISSVRSCVHACVNTFAYIFVRLRFFDSFFFFRLLLSNVYSFVISFSLHFRRCRCLLLFDRVNASFDCDCKSLQQQQQQNTFRRFMCPIETDNNYSSVNGFPFGCLGIGFFDTLKNCTRSPGW